VTVGTTPIVIRPLSELDIESITRIDEKVGGQYRPAFWEDRVAYYLRRDPEASRVAEIDGNVVGFMLADLKGGEFGLEETSAAPVPSACALWWTRGRESRRAFSKLSALATAR
jgi:hypothetical protein